MKKSILISTLLLILAGFNLQAQDDNSPDEIPFQMEEMLENMLKNFEDAFGEEHFFKMDTSFFKSFAMPFEGGSMPFDTSFFHSFSFPFDGETMPFDSSFFKSFSFPFDGQTMPFDSEQLHGLQEMMDDMMKGFMDPEQLKEWEKSQKEWEKQWKEEKGTSPKKKKRKTTVL